MVLRAVEEDLRRIRDGFRRPGLPSPLANGSRPPPPAPPSLNGHTRHPFSCDDLRGFRSVRRAVMQETWRRVTEREQRGEVITNRAFGDVMEQVWGEARTATALCPEAELIRGMI